jgi:subtilisin family serine protease
MARLPWLEVLASDSIPPLRPTSQFVPWGVDSIGSPTVWYTAGYTGSGIKVAVIDDGMACSHSDLPVTGGYDFELGSYTYCGVDGSHGTKAAGIIGARDNAIDVVGVAPGVAVYSLRACDNATPTNCDAAKIVDALNWAGWYGMDVVSISIAGCSTSAPGGFTSVMQSLYSDNVPVVVSHGTNTDCSPSAPPGWLAANSLTIAVSGYTPNGAYLPVYQYGSHVDFAAPAETHTLDVSGGYTTFGGVSSAVPHVAAAYALLAQAGFGGIATRTQRLKDTAHDWGASGKDNYYGWGGINVGAAVVRPPLVSSLGGCGGGAITVPGYCEMIAGTQYGAGTVSVRFVVSKSYAPNDSTVYDWGSATRDIYVPSGDYTLTVKTRAKDAYGRYSAVTNIWEVPVCTQVGNDLRAKGPVTTAATACGS